MTNNTSFLTKFMLKFSKILTLYMTRLGEGCTIRKLDIFLVKVGWSDVVFRIANPEVVR